MLQWTLGEMCLFDLCFPPDMHTGVNLLDHLVALFYFILLHFISISIFFWNRVDLQCCVTFCCTAQWSSYAYIQSFLDSFPMQVITEYWVEFPVLYSKPLFVISFIYSGVYVSIPISNLSLPPPLTLVTSILCSIVAVTNWHCHR